MGTKNRFIDWNFAAISVLLCCTVVHGKAIPENLNGFQDFQTLNTILEGKIEALDPDIILKTFFPEYLQTIVRLAQDGLIDWDKLFENIQSDNCKAHIFEWLNGTFRKDTDLMSDEDAWRLHLADSWGRIPESGILSGHVSFVGDFDECIDAKAENIPVRNQIPATEGSFEGHYCTAYIVPYKDFIEPIINPPQSSSALASIQEVMQDSLDMGIQKAVGLGEFLAIFGNQTGMVARMTPSFGVCLPNSCSQADITMFLINMIRSIAREEQYNSIPWLLPVACEERKLPPLKSDDIAMLSIISVIAGISLIAGVIDYWLQHGFEKPRKPGLALKYLMAFSLYTNTKKLISTRKGAEDMGCIHGIRFFSTSWVVLGHTFVVATMVPIWNYIDIKKIHEDWSLMPIINATFSVDTFFVMSGMLATYNVLKMLDKTKGKFNVPMFYIHRYLRLTPTYGILLGLIATLAVYASNGPTWNLLIPMQAQYCKDNWWINMLYINNLYKTQEMCHGETWYIANDMQFYIVSPLILYPLWKWESIGLVLLTLYTALSVVAPALVVWKNDTVPAALMNRSLLGFPEIYQRPWSRIHTFLVGVWLGWILHKTRGKQVRIHPIFVAALWLISTATVLAVIFGIYPWFDPLYEIPKWEGYFYASLSRFSFSLCISWVIFACLKGYGGIVNTFLSWKAFMPLGRLTFCVYLSSFYLQMIYHVRQTQPFKYDKYNMINVFFAHQVVCFLVGFLLTALFESPFIILQKLIFEGDRPSRPPREQPDKDRQPRERYGIFYNDNNALVNGGEAPLKIENEKQV